jgi:tetratricopeptide (TPR) repeat protein
MHRRLLVPITFALLAIIFLNAASARAQGVNSLEGRVMLPSGTQPAQPVRVTLMQSRRPVYETFTDLSGRFNFSGLRAGTYQLIAEGDGQTFETTSVTFDIGAFGGAQTFTQNIQLRAKAGASAQPAATVAAEEIDPEVPDAAKEKYRQGLKSAAAGKPEQAVKLFTEAVGAYERFYAANLALAEQLSKLQRYDEALAAYRRASELKPERADPYVGIGVTLVSRKSYDEGIKMLRGVIAVDKDLPAPYLSLGYAEMMTGDYKSAEEHLLRALELSKSALARIYLANTYEQTGEFSKAISQLEAYLKENPRSTQADAVRDAVEKLKKKAKDKKP